MSGDDPSKVPQGIERLLRRAAVDADFRVQLFEHRADAAVRIGVVLEPAEADMLNAVPIEQLQAMVAKMPRTPIIESKVVKLTRVRAPRGIRPGL